MLLTGQLIVATVAALAAVLLALFGTRITDRAVWRNPLVRRPVEAVAGLEGLRMSSPNATTDWRWSTFDRAVETPRSFVLLAARVGKAKHTPLFCYLPKSAAPHPVEVDRLRGLLGVVLPGGVRPR